MLKERIQWIDTLRGISIFLVVLGHTILPQSWLIYVFSFHIPLFFFISGFLFNAEKYQDSIHFVKRKATSLLWPYVVFFALNLVYWILFFGSNQYFEPIKQILYSSDKLFAPFIPLWFLPTLFVTEIIFYFLHKKYEQFWLFLSVIIACTTGFYLAKFKLIWGIDIALVAVLFYYLGFITRKYEEKIKKINILSITLIAGLFCLVNFLLAMYQGVYVTMIYRYYGQIWLYLPAAICGIIGYTFLAKILKRTILKNITIIDLIGRNSLIILGLHTIFYYYVSDFFRIFLDIQPKTSVLYSFIYTIITLALLSPFIYLINKTPLLNPKTKSRSR